MKNLLLNRRLVVSLEIRAAQVLWNIFGASAKILSSAYGPNSSLYSGGSFPDETDNAGYVPGVFGNALTIALTAALDASPRGYGTM